VQEKSIYLFYICKWPTVSLGPSFLVEVWATFSKLLGKILGRILILRQSWTISGEALTAHNFALLTN